jgi:RimJ/RimL family protein N-acetyltransferase
VTAPDSLDEPLWRPTLTSGRLVLRPPWPADVEARIGYGGHPEIIRMYGGDLQAPVPRSCEAAERWYAQVCADPLAWVIEAESRCVGVVRLHSLVERDRRARLAIGLSHPDLLGQGSAHERSGYC